MGSVMFYNASILLKTPFPVSPKGKGFALLPLWGWGVFLLRFLPDLIHLIKAHVVKRNAF